MELSPWYFGLKLAAYTAWMFLGLGVLRRGAGSRVPGAIVLGELRLLMGLLFGLVIWLAGTVVYAGVVIADPAHDDLLASLVTYALVYVPVRWVEWGIFEVASRPASRSWHGFVLADDGRLRRWRLGGIAISCLAAVPVVVALGGMLPVGRFMC